MLKKKFDPFENKVWLSSPTMYEESMKYMKEAYETNWMSTVGENIDEIEKSNFISMLDLRKKQLLKIPKEERASYLEKL